MIIGYAICGSLSLVAFIILLTAIIGGQSSDKPKSSRPRARIIYGILNLLAFLPIIGFLVILGISYAYPEYAKTSNVAYLGYGLALFTFITILSLPANLLGAIYFVIRGRDRKLSIALSIGVIVIALGLIAYNSFSF